MADDLSKSQREYIGHRVAGLSQRQSFLKAYPHSAKWKPDSVDQAACRLERTAKIAPKLKEARDRAVNEAIEEGIVDSKFILRELARIASANVTDYVRVKNGYVCIQETDELNDGKTAAIASIKEGANGIEIKLHSKVQALSKLAEIIGMVDTRNNGTEVDIEDLTPLAELRKK